MVNDNKSISWMEAVLFTSGGLSGREQSRDIKKGVRVMVMYLFNSIINYCVVIVVFLQKL